MKLHNVSTDGRSRRIPSLEACLLVTITVWQASPGKAQEANPDKKSSAILTITEFGEPEKGIGADQRSRVAHAITLLNQKKLEKARAEVDEVLSAFDKLMDNPKAIYVVVASRAELTQFQKRQTDNQKVVWIDWALGAALHTKAVIEVERKKSEDALALLEKASERAPYRADVWTEKAFILNVLKKPTEALKAYQKALELAENYPSAKSFKPVALRGLGYTQIELGEFAEARKALERSLKMDPTNRLGLNELTYLANLFAKRRQWAEAASCFAAIAEATPTNADARYHEALALVALGENKRFDECRQKMVRDFAETQDPLSAMQVIALAVLTPGKWRAEDIATLKAHAKLVTEKADKSGGLEWEGAIQFRLGNLAASRSAFEDALKRRSADAKSDREKDPKGPVYAAAFFALVELADGRTEAAKVRYEEARQRYQASLKQETPALSWEAKVYRGMLLEEAKTSIAKATKD